MSARAGFTLIEVLAVIAIISILAAVLFTQLGGQTEAAQTRMTAAYLTQIEAALSTYESDEGRYPPSRFSVDDVPDGGGTNRGIEALVSALWSNGRNGLGLEDDHLINIDGDESSRNLTDFPKRDLFELKDQFDNPIAYFERRDYGEEHLYTTMDPNTGELDDWPVKAHKNPVTGDWHNRLGFQLISAGPDGMFGTADDIANFDLAAGEGE